MGIEDQFGRPVSQQRVDARKKHGVNDPETAKAIADVGATAMDDYIRDKKAGYTFAARSKKLLAEGLMKKAGLLYDLPFSAERMKLLAEGEIKKAVQVQDLSIRRRPAQPHKSLSDQLPHAKPLGESLFQARENFLQARDAYDPEKDLLESAIKLYRLELDREFQKARDSKDKERVAQLEEEMRQLESVRYGTNAAFKAETMRKGIYLRDTGLDKIEHKKDPKGLDEIPFGRDHLEDDEADLG